MAVFMGFLNISQFVFLPLPSGKGLESGGQCLQGQGRTVCLLLQHIRRDPRDWSDQGIRNKGSVSGLY